MRSSQENRFSMMKTTEVILIKHNAVWITFTAFSDLVTAFQNTNAEITALISVQTQPIRKPH